MNDKTKRINEFLRLATKQEVQDIKDKIYLTDHQEEVFNMFYLKKKNINYIADMTGYSRDKVCDDLKLIREKINKVM